MGWTHPAKETYKHHQAVLGVESPRQEEKRQTKADLAPQPVGGTQDCWADVGESQGIGQGPTMVEKNC